MDEDAAKIVNQRGDDDHDIGLDGHSGVTHGEGSNDGATRRGVVKPDITSAARPRSRREDGRGRRPAQSTQRRRGSPGSIHAPGPLLQPPHMSQPERFHPRKVNPSPPASGARWQRRGSAHRTAPSPAAARRCRRTAPNAAQPPSPPGSARRSPASRVAGRATPCASSRAIRSGGAVEDVLADGDGRL